MGAKILPKSEKVGKMRVQKTMPKIDAIFEVAAGVVGKFGHRFWGRRGGNGITGFET